MSANSMWHQELTKLKYPVKIFTENGKISKSKEYFKLKGDEGLYKDNSDIEDKLYKFKNGTFAEQTEFGYKFFRLSYESLPAYMKFLQKNNKCNLYEVTTNDVCKIYFDLEKEINTIDIKEQALFIRNYLNIFEYFKICLNYYLKNTRKLFYDETKDIILNSHEIRDDGIKISFHYIIPTIAMSKEQMKMMVHNFIYTEFIPYCERKINDGLISPCDLSFIDTSVYTKNRNFRILANSKYGKNRPLVCKDNINILDSLLNYGVWDMPDQLFDIGHELRRLAQTEKIPIENREFEHSDNYQYISELFKNMKNDYDDYNDWLAIGFAIKSTKLTDQEKINIYVEFTLKYEKYKFDTELIKNLCESIIMGSTACDKPIKMGTILYKSGKFRKNINPEFFEKYEKKSTKKILESLPENPLSEIDQYDSYCFSDFVSDTCKQMPYENMQDMINKMLPNIKKTIALIGSGTGGWIFKDRINCPGVYYKDFPSNSNINITYGNGDIFDKNTGEKKTKLDTIKLSNLLINDPFRQIISVYNYMQCDPVALDKKTYNTWAHPLYIKTNKEFIAEIKLSPNFKPSDIIINNNAEYLSREFVNDYIKKSGCLNQFLEYIYNCWSGDRDEIYNYLLARDRHIIINYQNPSEVAIFAKSEMGTGKNTKIEFLRDHVLGHHMCHTYNGVEQLDKDFNSELMNKVYILVDECAIPGKEKFKIFDNMKAKITGKTIDINGKFKDVITIRNILNFDFLSNHEDAIYLELNDRRYLVITIYKWHMKDTDFWNDFYKKNFNNITGLMYFYYLYYDIDNIGLDNIDLRNVPMTKEKQELINLYLDSALKFLFEKKDYLIKKYDNSENNISMENYERTIKNIVEKFQQGEISAITMTELINAVDKPGNNSLTDEMLYIEYERWAKTSGSYIENKTKFFTKIKSRIKKNLMNNNYDPRTIEVDNVSIIKNEDNNIYHYFELFVTQKMESETDSKITYSKVREEYLTWLESIDVIKNMHPDEKTKYAFNQKQFSAILTNRFSYKIICKQKYVIGWQLM